MKDINTDNHFQKTMQIKVEQGVFEQIISQAKQDGIQKLVVGAVIVRGG